MSRRTISSVSVISKAPEPATCAISSSTDVVSCIEEADRASSVPAVTFAETEPVERSVTIPPPPATIVPSTIVAESTDIEPYAVSILVRITSSNSKIAISPVALVTASKVPTAVSRTIEPAA